MNRYKMKRKTDKNNIVLYIPYKYEIDEKQKIHEEMNGI